MDVSQILTALIVGAGAIGKGAASQAGKEAYEKLKSLLVQKLGKGGAVQSVEDDPESTPAQEALVEAVAKKGLAQDQELAERAAAVTRALAAETTGGGAGDIEIGRVQGRVNAIVERLTAAGRIHLESVTAETGDAVVRDLNAGAFRGPEKNRQG